MTCGTLEKKSVSCSGSNVVGVDALATALTKLTLLTVSALFRFNNLRGYNTVRRIWLTGPAATILAISTADSPRANAR